MESLEMTAQRPGGLRRAADAIFALVSLLPLLLVVLLVGPFDRLHETMSQVGSLLAVSVARLRVILFRQLVDRISDQVVGLGRMAQGHVDVPAPSEAAAVVPGLGRVAEIGEIAQAFSGMLRELKSSTERLEDLVF